MDAVEHRERILAMFTAEFRKKYDAGQKEHGGQLWKDRDVFEEAVSEVIDLVAYLYTYREFQRKPIYGGAQFDPYQMSPAFVSAAERIKFIKQYKTPLPATPMDRKLSILAEEFGEVARAVMEFNHRDPSLLRNELVDLAAFALAWIGQMDEDAVGEKLEQADLRKDRG